MRSQCGDRSGRGRRPARRGRSARNLTRVEASSGRAEVHSPSIPPARRHRRDARGVQRCRAVERASGRGIVVPGEHVVDRELRQWPVPIAGAVPTITFSADTVTGPGGCNHIGGRYQVDSATGQFATRELGSDGDGLSPAGRVGVRVPVPPGRWRVEPGSDRRGGPADLSGPGSRIVLVVLIHPLPPCATPGAGRRGLASVAVALLRHGMFRGRPGGVAAAGRFGDGGRAPAFPRRCRLVPRLDRRRPGAGGHRGHDHLRSPEPVR